MGNVLAGIAAGAVGTTALNIVTYLDMAVRGRPPSEMPNKAVEMLEDKLGLASAGEERAAYANRRSALGALAGLATGLTVGGIYGVLRPRFASVGTPVAGIALGMAAMAGSDVPLTLSGLTDPREWSSSDWASDVIPHLAYGISTAAAFEALGNG